ncbi:MAG: lamin tail domain-containing protein [Candidatus Andersenbacteria bacterium]|nr:lamin tail domain-containing protein [Candidatus Andersenbacteria bacterium]
MEGHFQSAGVVVGVRVTAALGLAVFLLLGLPLLVSAALPTVVINEVMWDGTEYVEFLNTTEGEISLGGWSLTRQQAGGEAKTMVTFGAVDVIPAGAYFLLEKTEAATTVSGNKIAGALTLVNTGELVVLLDAAGVVVDQAGQLGEWFAGENTTDGVAMERTGAELSGTVAGSWHTSTGSSGGRSGTPGVVNSAPAVNAAPEAILSGPASGLVGEELAFSAEDSTDAEDDTLTYSWNFGDGAAGSGAGAEHTYTAAGTYAVRVTVSDGALEDEAGLTVSVTAPVYSAVLVINEFLPNPVGSDSTGEFIEIKNTGSDSVDVSGWRLDDEDGGSTPFTIPDGVSVAAGAVRSWLRSDTKLALNNDGDTVRLLDPAGVVKSSFSYADTVPEGQSYNRTAAGEWRLSTTVTAGAENVITAPAEDDEDEAEAEEEEESIVSDKAGRVAGESVVVVPLAEVRGEEAGTVVETEGVVSAPPGVFGGKVMYLAGSGIQVYFSQGKFPKLALGDRVKVRGELGTSLGENRIKLTAASDIAASGSAGKPEPHRVATGDIGEEWEGSLVAIEGSVSSTSGDTFYVDDGSGEVKVFIKESTKIDKPKMQRGTDVTITGVVSRTNAGYRLLPRWQEDVRLGRVAGLTSFPDTGVLWLWSVVVVGVLGVVINLARRAGEPLA